MQAWKYVTTNKLFEKDHKVPTMELGHWRGALLVSCKLTWPRSSWERIQTETVIIAWLEGQHPKVSNLSSCYEYKKALVLLQFTVASKQGYSLVIDRTCKVPKQHNSFESSKEAIVINVMEAKGTARTCRRKLGDWSLFTLFSYTLFGIPSN